jgi:hypothetical protein
MSREQLRNASDLLREAGELANDEELQQRIHNQSNKLATAVDADRDPDHGQLARHMNALAEIAEDIGEEGEAKVREARDAVAEFRSTVEGV